MEILAEMRIVTRIPTPTVGQMRKDRGPDEEKGGGVHRMAYQAIRTPLNDVMSGGYGRDAKLSCWKRTPSPRGESNCKQLSGNDQRR